MNEFNQQHFNDFEEEERERQEQPYLRPIYEQIWFIVVVFICFWPAGMILAIWRFIRDQQISAADMTQDTPPLSDWADMQAEGAAEEAASEAAAAEEAREEQKRKINRAKVSSKRSCKTWKIWGWILIVLGVLDLWTITEEYTMRGYITTISTGAGFIIAGVIMLIAAKRTVQKWDRYESFINNKGNTSIQFLAERMGLPEKTVRTDIQAMINKGFFDKPKYGISAYINGEYDLLVMTKNGEPMETLKKQRKKKDQAPAGSYLAQLQEEIDRTTDEELLSILRNIEGSVTKIEEKLAEEPALKEMTAIKKLKETYLPQTLELIRKFNDGEGSDETRWEIKAMLGTCAKAFNNINAKVHEREDIDTRVDMEVLRKTFEREGLLGSDFDFDKK